MNQSILCNCDIETESNFLLESLAACEGPETKTELEMHFTINLAFVNYFNDMIEEIGQLKNKFYHCHFRCLRLTPICSMLQKKLQDLAIQYRNKKKI